jgi:hypothetical protein
VIQWNGGIRPNEKVVPAYCTTVTPAHCFWVDFLAGLKNTPAPWVREGWGIGKERKKKFT